MSERAPRKITVRMPETKRARKGEVVALTGPPGTRVAAGEEVMVLRIARRQHAVRAPRSGRVVTLVEPGDTVRAGDPLYVLALDAAALEEIERAHRALVSLDPPTPIEVTPEAVTTRDRRRPARAGWLARAGRPVLAIALYAGACFLILPLLQDAARSASVTGVAGLAAAALAAAGLIYLVGAKRGSFWPRRLSGLAAASWTGLAAIALFFTPGDPGPLSPEAERALAGTYLVDAAPADGGAVALAEARGKRPTMATAPLGMVAPPGPSRGTAAPSRDAGPRFAVLATLPGDAAGLRAPGPDAATSAKGLDLAQTRDPGSGGRVPVLMTALPGVPPGPALTRPVRPETRREPDPVVPYATLTGLKTDLAADPGAGLRPDSGLGPAGRRLSEPTLARIPDQNAPPLPPPIGLVVIPPEIADGTVRMALYLYHDDPRVPDPPAVGGAWPPMLPPRLRDAVRESEVTEIHQIFQVAGWCPAAVGGAERTAQLSDRIRLIEVRLVLDPARVGAVEDAIPVLAGAEPRLFHNRYPLMGDLPGTPLMALGRAYLRALTSGILDPNMPDLPRGGHFYDDPTVLTAALSKFGCDRTVWNDGSGPTTPEGTALARALGG